MDADLKDFLISHSLEGIVVTDLEGNILQCNETAHHMLGYRHSDLNEHYVGIIFPPQSVSHLLPNLLHLAVADSGFEGDIILQDYMGDSIMVRLNAMVWPSVKPSRILLRFLDWRETHEIVEKLKESSQMAALGMLTRSLSHEILNPISVIGGHTRRLLESVQDDSREEEWALQVLAGVDRLESMVQTINTFLNLPAPCFEKGSLSGLLADSMGEIKPETERLGIRIQEEMGGKLPPVFMDPGLLKKAFSAVLLNAIDRMPKGGDLKLGSFYSDGFCRLLVEDSGPSLDTMQIEEDLSPVHVIGVHQTHLNLAIARRIVEEHGGQFDIGASTGVGLKVRISLPADRRTLDREREM